MRNLAPPSPPLASPLPVVPVLLALALLAHLAACASSDSPTFEDVPPAEELYAEGMDILEGTRFLWVWPYTDYTAAIDAFQAIIDNYPYSEYAVIAELRIADAYFESGRYDEALSYYRDFADLHPDHDKVAYTILRSAMCHYEQVRSIDRDQTSTAEALQYLELLISRYPYTPEAGQGERLLRELRTRLAASVLRTGDFYLDRHEYQAAAERYRSLLNSYPGLGLDAEGLLKLGVCYEHMKREDEALRLFHVVVENFPDTDLSATASERIAAMN